MISIVACCHSAKLCAHAARDFRLQQNSAVTRMWRSCRVQPSHKERAIGVVRCKRRGCCCNLSGGVALIVWFSTNGMCVKNNTIIYVVGESNIKKDCERDLYCCLLPRCEALCICRWGFPIATALGLRLGLSFTFSSFLPNLYLPCCALLLCHRWCMNKFSNFKIHRRFYSHCLM